MHVLLGYAGKCDQTYEALIFSKRVITIKKSST